MLKKIIALLITIVLTFNFMVAFANNVTIMFNGSEMQLDTNAYIKDERTMVPLRGVFAAVGATVSWDKESRTAIIAKPNGDDVTFIFLQIGSDKAFVNSEEKQLDAPAEIVNERTMVPLRFIMDELGATVEWDETTRTVYINN